MCSAMLHMSYRLFTLLNASALPSHSTQHGMTPRKEEVSDAGRVRKGQKPKLPIMDSRRPIITVAGTAGVGKKSIVARIIGHADDAALSFPCPWTIDTKYYTANVQIEVVSFTDGECCGAHVSDSEALLLVFDVTHKESLHSLQNWIQSLDGNVPEVCLMLANRMDLLVDVSDAQHSWHGLAQDWCCHNLFEYIEVSSWLLLSAPCAHIALKPTQTG